MKGECSCWVKYPNSSHKKKNGKWKCIDDYENISDLQQSVTSIGCIVDRRKTKCRRKVLEAEE